MTEFFNYDTSWLNPALKLLNVVIYMIVVYWYFKARRLYTDDLHIGFTILGWMGIIAMVAALFRYFGHGTQFGFTSELSLKWFQSLGYLIQAILYVSAGRWFAKGLIPVIRE
ncbi:MAG: hypothetical protein JEZ00_16725 [Anaerolineaceae bacterium]|nr:hypothetical protein [Anaerolineaceae bacterium]